MKVIPETSRAHYIRYLRFNNIHSIIRILIHLRILGSKKAKVKHASQKILWFHRHERNET
jgi:hypothetical protein